MYDTWEMHNFIVEVHKAGVGCDSHENGDQLGP